MSDLNHPNAPAAKDNPVTHVECGGSGCSIDGGSGLVPAWIYEERAR